MEVVGPEQIRPFRGRPYRDFSYPRCCAPVLGEGDWRPDPSTFRVEEIPLYDFSGEGDHAALWIEKEGKTTRDVAVGVARRLGLPPAAVGYAGMKDKLSSSVQAFTVAGADESAVAEAFEAEGCGVRSATRHRNKLRLGHLAGNAFAVFLEGAGIEGAEEVLRCLARLGVPNYYGPQRFGAGGDNAVRGLSVLRGTLRVNRWKRDLLVSALQSLVFNEVLARRVTAGTLGEALAGDVLRREDSGGLFVCTDPAAERSRVAAFEVAPTGPMPGRKMVRPQGAVAGEEASVLGALGLEESLFAREPGSRRPLRFRLGSVRAEAAGSGIWVRFSCPAGCYATAVIRELLGRDPRADAGG